MKPEVFVSCSHLGKKGWEYGAWCWPCVDGIEKAAFGQGFIAGRIQGMKDGDSCTSKSMEIAIQATRNKTIDQCADIANRRSLLEFSLGNTLREDTSKEICERIRALKEVKR